MAKIDKVLGRFYSIPKDFTWDELVQVLNSLGYAPVKMGGSGGSRRKFSNDSNHVVNLHEPHKGSKVQVYALKQLIENLESQKKILETTVLEQSAEQVDKTKKSKKKKSNKTNKK